MFCIFLLIMSVFAGICVCVCERVASSRDVFLRNDLRDMFMVVLRDFFDMQRCAWDPPYPTLSYAVRSVQISQVDRFQLTSLPCLGRRH